MVRDSRKKLESHVEHWYGPIGFENLCFISPSCLNKRQTKLLKWRRRSPFGVFFQPLNVTLMFCLQLSVSAVEQLRNFALCLILAAVTSAVNLTVFKHEKKS